MLNYNIYFRQFGIRKVGQLLTPPLPILDRLDLPRNGILHYPGETLLDDGPSNNEFIFRNYNRPIMVANVIENGDSRGNPRLLATPVDPIIRSYFMKNRRYRRLPSIDDIPIDQNRLSVVNYSLIPRRYRYVRNIYSEYNKYYNHWAAIWEGMNTVANSFSMKHNFILMRLPKVLPSVSELRQAEKIFSQNTLKIFNSDERLFILHMWFWLGKKRNDSLLNKIEEKNLDKVNIVFIDSGRFFIINLGILNSWRNPTKEEMAGDDDLVDDTAGFAPGQIQKRFLRLLISLIDVKTSESVVENINLNVINNKIETDVTDSTTTEGTDSKVTINITTKTEDVEQSPQEYQVSELELYDDYDDGVMPELDLITDDELDKELEALEEIARKYQEEQEEKRILEMTDIDIDNLDDVDDDDDFIYSDDDIETADSYNITITETDSTPEKPIKQYTDALAVEGLISAAEYKRFNELAQSYKTIVAPNGSQTLEDFINIPEKILEIPKETVMEDKKTVFDKTMLKSSLLEFDKHYINDVMQKDIANAVMAIQKAGIIVTGYEVEEVNDIMGDYFEYKVSVRPVEGRPSTLRFKLPKVNEDGTWKSNGSIYYTRKMISDLPIVKINERQVALSSYYGKLMVERSRRKVNNYGDWLCDQITNLDIQASGVISDLVLTPQFDNKFSCPKLYSILALRFSSFNMTILNSPTEVGNQTYHITLDHRMRLQLYGDLALKAYDNKNQRILGITKKGDFLVVDKLDALYHATKLTSNDDKGVLTPIGNIETVLELRENKAPVEYADLKVLGKYVPIGFILAYDMGLDKLMKLLKVRVQRVPVGTRVNLAENQYALVFNDETLVFSKDNRKAAMILAGFLEYRKIIRQYNVHEFNSKDVYFNVIESAGLNFRYLQEVNNLYQLFIDPITLDLLRQLKEPTTFRGLLIKSCELLLNDQYPDVGDGKYQRIKGYERFAGLVYSELVTAARIHNLKSNKVNQSIDLNPSQIWITISRDNAKVQISEINPIENLKQQESITYTGIGGRTSRTMNKASRALHDSDKGMISEATQDSSDVGVSAYLPANPLFTSVRGLTSEYNKKEDGMTSLLSTSSLLSPSVTKDDMRRAIFISIQNKHVVPSKGYSPSLIRTGYEQVIANRTSDLFAFNAQQDGVVIDVTPTGILIEYKDGERKGFQLGRRFGKAQGLTIPHEVVTRLKKGDKFKRDDNICYNTSFFEPDVLNRKQVVLKTAKLVTTALMENPLTLEDSSAISPKIAQALSSPSTEVRNIVVNFDQHIHDLVKVGEELHSDNILCIIEDPIGDTSAIIDDAALDTLRALSANTPLAKKKGVVEKIEVFYNGEKSDMSETLRSITNRSDREFAKLFKSIGSKVFTGRVNDEFRLEGKPLLVDTACITIYISSNDDIVQGDKGVFANQLKTVFGEVLEEEVRAEDGTVVDAIFGKLSVDNRIVGSVDEIGTTNVLLELLAKRAIEAYDK